MLLAPTAQAQVRVRPSSVWGHTYAGNSAPAANATTSKSSPSANLEKVSKFAVTYNSFPIWARTEVQAALDTWATNFKSSVDITVTATWGRSANSDVLGSARPGSYFAGFIGAPDSTLWYPSALANALAGKDLDRDNAEIIIQVNVRATLVLWVSAQSSSSIHGLSYLTGILQEPVAPSLTLNVRYLWPGAPMVEDS